MNKCNYFWLKGKFLEKKVLRFTPSGVAVFESALSHQSEQNEAELKRSVECEAPVIAIGAIAEKLNLIDIDRTLIVRGFLAAKNQRQRQRHRVRCRERAQDQNKKCGL